MYFKSSPEYEARVQKPFKPTNLTYKDINAAMPKGVLEKSPATATYYVVRDIALTAAFVTFASCITPWAATDFWGYVTSPLLKTLLKSVMWGTYWWLQGMLCLGIFILGHEAGHMSLYNSKLINDIVGYVMHTIILVPYFSWKFSHIMHHKATGSMEHDENYIPYTRSDYKLPDERRANRTDYKEAFEETPLASLWRIFVMLLIGWWAYLSTNAMGSPTYPNGTNHWNPNSVLFKDNQKKWVLFSDVTVLVMAAFLISRGSEFFLWYYLPPYLLVNHWIILFTFLQHTDPTIPHYRKGEWTFVRGAATTIDRPILGKFGSFFFHNATHFHVAHHFFSRSPFFNGPQITEALKEVLKDDYNYDSTPTLYALYRNFTQCIFVEDEGDILFYKNRNGVAGRKLADEDDIRESSDQSS